MRFNIFSFVWSILLCTLLLIVVLPGKAKELPLTNDDSLAIQRWVKPIKDSIFNKPNVILPWLDSLSHYADSTQSPYANYAKNNLKGNYFWAIRRFDSAVNFYKAAIHWTIKGDLRQQQISANGNLGLLYSSMDEFDSSTYYYQKSIDMAKKYNYKKLYVSYLLNISYVYNQRGAYADAVELLEEARIMNESLGDEDLEIMLYSAFGSVYYYLGDIKQMKKYYQRAIDHYLKGNNKSILSTLYGNIAEAYSSLAHNYDSSAYYFTKAYEFSIPQNRNHVVHIIDLTRGSIYYNDGIYDSAAFYYQRALDNPLSEVYSRRKAALLVNMGNVYRVKNMFNTAVEYYNKGYELSDSLKFLVYKANALFGLIKIDSIRGDFEQAFFRNLEWQQIKATLKKDDVRNQMMASEVERALEVQRLKNELLEVENNHQVDLIENQRWIGLLIVLAFIGSLAFTWIQFLNHKKIRRLNKLLRENVNRLDTQNLELDQLNKTKDKFFSIVSHDLRSPFAAIRNTAVILNAEWESFNDTERAETLKQLDKSTENTHNLLEELLQWSQIQQGLMKLTEKTFSAIALIDELMELFKSITSDKDIQLIVVSDKEVELNTDYQMLKQLLHNLLSNAVKFTPRGGEIIIKLQSESGRVSISVRDNGIGIPKEKQSGIFALDCDFGRPGTEGEKSSGMGLILCLDYARLMGAKLELESEEGQGSAFTVIF